jgi:hypothetical protein
MCAGVVGLRVVLARAGTRIVGLWAAFMLALYAPALTPLQGSSYSLRAIAIAALCLAGYCLLALAPDRHGEDSASTDSVPALAIDSPA